MKRLAPLLATGLLGLLFGVAVAETLDEPTDSADTADTADSAPLHDSEALDSDAFLDDTGEPVGEDTGDAGDTGDSGDPDETGCGGRGLFVGDLTFSTPEALADFARAYDEVSGRLRLVGIDGVQDLSSLHCLRSAAALEIEGMPALRSALLEDFETSRVSLVGNPLLQDVQLDVHELSGGLVVADQPALRQLSVPIYATSTLTLQNLGGAFVELDRLVLVEGDVRLSGLSGTLDLGRLTRVNGDLLLRDLANRDLRFLDGLVHVSGDVAIVGMPALKSLKGPRLARVNRLTIASNPLLASLDGLEDLVEISTLHLEALPELRDLSGIENLRRLDAVEGDRRYRKLLMTE